MTTLSHTTGYAIEALACLAGRRGESMLVREIAGETGMPSPYLSKVLQRLCDAGIVETKRGYRGGIRLARAPTEINLLEIDLAVECGRSVSHTDPEPRADTFWQAFHQSYLDRLAAMTLADVLVYQTQKTGKP